jgi:hypothetical protein
MWRPNEAAVNARWTPTESKVILHLSQANEFQSFIRDNTSPAERISLRSWL